jgi:glycosyltransferase involved in cell wall biosynthesis
MKIILSAYGFFPNALGGGEVYVYRLAKEYLRRRHDVVVLTSTPWEKGDSSWAIDNYSYEEIPVVTYALNPEKATALEKYTGLGPLTSQALREIISKIKPDIVHINGIKPALTLLCNEMHIPHVITAHHAGIACPSGALLRRDDSICTAAANLNDCVRCCNYSRRPKWYTGGVLGRLPSSIYRPLGERLNRAKNLRYLSRGLIYPWLVEKTMEGKRIVLDKARLIIAPSVWIKDLLIWNGCDSSRIAVVKHGIEPVGRVPFEPFEGRLVKFGYIGRINQPKGLHVILQALDILEDEAQCELHVYGKTLHPWEDKYLRGSLEKYKGSSRIKMHGNLPNQKLAEAFKNIDVLIVPSLVPESFGLVVHEAFSAGRPVIVFNSGALPELVRDGIDGFIVERNNSWLLAEAMRKIILNPGMIIEFSERLPLVKTIQEYADEMEKIYRGVIHKNKLSVSMNAC